MTEGALCQILAGKRTPSVMNAQRIAAAIGITIDYLYAVLAEARRERERTLAVTVSDNASAVS